jgi:hypothetical protein
LTYSAAGARTILSPYNFTPVFQNTDNTQALVRAIYYNDPLTLIVSCYAAFTGSMRVQFWQQIADVGSNVKYGVGAITQSGTADIVTDEASGDAKTSSRQWFFGDEVVDISLPPFIQTAGLITAANYVGNTLTGNSQNGGTGTAVRVFTLGLPDEGGAYVTNLAREGGDDFNCYHFVSTPLLVQRTVL